MKQIYFTCLILFLTCNAILHGQNIWGVDASVDVANAEFQNNFIETGTSGSYAPSNWTALSIYDDNRSRFPGNAYWTRSDTGRSQGGYRNSLSPSGLSQSAINSDSRVNGAAIFDSDFLDNGGVLNFFVTGPSPSFHQGELISPRMDLSGYKDAPIGVKFYSYYRVLTIRELSVSFSSDDGT